MKTDTNHPKNLQSISISGPPIFWPSLVAEPNTDAGRFIFRRYHVTPGIADVIAAAAGLGEVRS